MSVIPTSRNQFCLNVTTLVIVFNCGRLGSSPPRTTQLQWRLKCQATSVNGEQLTSLMNASGGVPYQRHPSVSNLLAAACLACLQQRARQPLVFNHRLRTAPLRSTLLHSAPLCSTLYSAPRISLHLLSVNTIHHIPQRSRPLNDPLLRIPSPSLSHFNV